MLHSRSVSIRQVCYSRVEYNFLLRVQDIDFMFIIVKYIVLLNHGYQSEFFEVEIRQKNVLKCKINNGFMLFNGTLIWSGKYISE